MLGTSLTWEQIFKRTDRDINLQRVMSAEIFGEQTGVYDWIPDRAIGPMPVTERRGRLMSSRKAALTELIQAYYGERGWTESGIPRPAVLKELGLWEFLREDTRARISAWQADR